MQAMTLIDVCIRVCGRGLCVCWPVCPWSWTIKVTLWVFIFQTANILVINNFWCTEDFGYSQKLISPKNVLGYNVLSFKTNPFLHLLYHVWHHEITPPPTQTGWHGWWWMASPGLFLLGQRTVAQRRWQRQRWAAGQQSANGDRPWAAARDIADREHSSRCHYPSLMQIQTNWTT